MSEHPETPGQTKFYDAVEPIKPETLWMLAHYADEKAAECEDGSCGMGGGVSCVMVRMSAKSAASAARALAKAIADGLVVEHQPNLWMRKANKP